jgi:pimeloyl-ACP methyl ester carboxylesterase
MDQDVLTYTRSQLTFRALSAGERDNEAVVLLHGFPADAKSWLPIADQLAQNGYRVLMPEQRGYSPEARPTSRRAYAVGELADDVAELMAAAGVKSAHVVGHDWGGGVAWEFARKYPESVSSLTIISAPHPRAVLSSMWRSRQALLSWYMLLFQLPYVPEWVFTRKQGAALTRLLTRTGLNRQSASRYAENMQEKGSMTAALNWYRAMLVSGDNSWKTEQTKWPTLLICGGKDSFVSHKAALLTEQWVNGPYRLMFLPEETHWIPEESPEMLAGAIQKFIRQGTSAE